MRIPRSYTDQTLAADLEVTLATGPSAHLARALRMAVGDNLVLFNGDGMAYPAVLTSVAKNAVCALVQRPLQDNLESPLRIHLGIALSRGDRMDWVVQKATELGVASIAPLLTGRTGVKLAGDRARKKLRHWQQVVISACEQSGRNCLPTLAEPVGLNTWLAGVSAERRFVLHHRATSAPAGTAQPGSVALLIGPEGGLAPEEIQAAEQAGFESLRLGPRVLRTETAPLAAIAVLQARWGDMQPLP